MLKALFILIYFLINSVDCNAQSGLLCSNAINMPTLLDTSTIVEELNQQNIWYKFIAKSNEVEIDLFSQSMSDTNNFTWARIYSGTCGNLIQIGYDSVLMQNDFVLSITVNNLIIGDTCFLQIGANSSISSTLDFYISAYFFNPPLLLPPVPCDYIVNGDFEAVTLPSGQVLNSVNQLNFAIPWQKGTLGTSDLFNGAAPFPGLPGLYSVGVNQNSFGIENSRNYNGVTNFENGYAGFYAFFKQSPTVYNHEYVQQYLATPLRSGVSYFVSFWVSRAENGGITETTGASDGIGAYLSVSKPFSNTNLLLTSNGTTIVSPQIKLNPISPIYETNGWVQISGTYTAVGGERWITIGGFNNVDTYPINSGDPNPRTSYYYLDDVTLVAQDFPITPLKSCLGNPITFVAPTGLNVNWTSNPSSNFTCLTCSTTVATPQTNNTTYISAALGLFTGCTITGNATIYAPPATPIISGLQTVCLANNTVTYTTPHLAGHTFVWQYGGTTFNGSVNSSGLNQATFVITSSGNVTVYSINTVTSCSSPTAIFPVTLNAMACCNGQGVFINNDINTSSPNFPIIPNGSTIYILSGKTLTIDNAATFILTNCILFFENGASISVDMGKSLKLVGCHLKGCNSMWNGISLLPNATIEVESSMIENALTAIFCSTNPTYKITNSIFNKNKTDIHIPSIPTIISKIKGSVFTSRNLTAPGSIYIYQFASDLRGTNSALNYGHYAKSDLTYWPNSTVPYRRSQSAINIVFVASASLATLYDITIGDLSANYSTTGNLFDNHDYGIKSFQSNVEVVNCVFQEMLGYDYATYSTGIGVWAYNGTTNNYRVKIGGYNTNGNDINTFINCGIGVLIGNYSNALVAGNILKKTIGSNQAVQAYSGKFGIKFYNFLNSYFDCNYNKITNIYRGIEWAQNSSDRKLECNFNRNEIIATTDICNLAIYLHALPSYKFNEISFVNVDLNRITNVTNGIKVENFGGQSRLSISENHEISLINGGTKTSQNGINVTYCNYTQINKNANIHSNGYLNNKYLSAISMNSCEQSLINCNSVHDIGTGIAFDGTCTGQFLEGILHNNNFTNYFTAIEIRTSANIGTQGSPNYASDNTWNSNNAGTYDLKKVAGNSTTPSFRLRNLSNGTIYQPVDFYPNGNAFSFPQANAISNVICTNNNSASYISTVLSSEELIMIRKQASGKLTFPVLELASNWKFANQVYQRLMNDSTLNPTDTVVINFRDSLQLTNIGKFYSVNEYLLNKNWAQAESNNQAILPQNNLEVNLKKVNSYYLDFHLDTLLYNDSTWLSNMINELRVIAGECYVTGGPAVLSALTMLSYFTNELFEENEDCYRYPSDSIVLDTANTLCDLVKNYSVPAITGATYSWTVPNGTTFTQTGNSIALNWGSHLLTGGTIYCEVMDSLGNTSLGSFTQDSLITLPSCVTATANNTSCVTATYLSWASPVGCAAGYYILLGTNGGGTAVPNNILDTLDIGNVTSYALPAYLTPNTVHYYKVIPYNNAHVPVSGCVIGSFTSGSSVAFTPTLGNPYLANFNSVTAPTLPCGITVRDENFPQDNYTWEINSVESCSGSNSLTIAKNSNNTTVKNDWFYSHPLNLTAGELYRFSYKLKAEDGYTESLESFIAQSADAATMLTNSAITNSNTTSTSCISDSGDFIAPTSSVYFVGGHATSAAGEGTLYIDDLKVGLIKTTRLTTASCGDSLFSCDTLHCLAYTGATSYKFRFENLTISFSQDYTVTTANPKVYQFLGSNPLVLGQSYSVTVAALVGGVWTPFGAACDVYLKPVPIRGLTGASCGGTLSDLSQLIYTNTTGICLINDYKYEFTDQSNNTVIETQRNSAVTSFLMTYITSPYVKYSTTYSVRVKLKIGTTWGEYGAACNVTTPASPLTKLANSYCNYTLPTFATPVNCVSVLGAQDYRYNITGPNNYNRTFTRNSSLNNWYFTWTNSAPYMQASTTYDVKVASRAGGVWSDYGDVCTITTPATLSRLADTTYLQQVLQPIFEQIEKAENSLRLSIFPNPNNNDEVFSIELTGIVSSNQSVELSLLNVVGESVFISIINTNEENRIIIQPKIKLTSGVYIVVAAIDGVKLRKKFVVK